MLKQDMFPGLTCPSERPSLVQKRDESIPERIIRATHHVRTALLAGCTTYR